MTAPRLGVVLVVLSILPAVRGDEPAEKAPSIVVMPAPAPKSKLVLVLDCSGSMLTRDVTTLAGTKRYRFDVACEAIRHVATSLPPEVDLALVAFGHRAGYQSIGQGFQVVRKRGVPATLDPAEDVEVLAPFDAPRKKLLESLAGLAPYGESPQYGALLKALTLCDIESTVPQRIVLITDGKNQVSNESKSVTRQELSAAWDEKSKVAIHFVLLGAEAKAQVRLHGTKGQESEMFGVSSAEWVTEAIASPTHPTGFAVVEDTRPLGIHPLGQKWVAARHDWKAGDPARALTVFLTRQNPGLNVEFLARQEVVVKGGDELQLPGSDFKPLARAPLFTGQQHPTNEVVHGRSRIRFLRPADFPTFEMFYLSLLSPQSVRPESVRIEFSPLAGEKPASNVRIIFTRPDYDLDWPVPILQCGVPKNEWPEGADAVEIRAWVPWEDHARPKRMWTADDLIVGARLEAVPGVEIKRLSDTKRETGRVINIELHAPGGNVGDWELSMQPAPDRTRVESASIDQSRYSFIYDAPWQRGEGPAVQLRHSVNIDAIEPAVRRVPRP